MEAIYVHTRNRNRSFHSDMVDLRVHRWHKTRHSHLLYNRSRKMDVAPSGDIL